METVIRVTLIYLVILAGLRLMGKRAFGQLSPLELVTLLLIPELVAHALLREDFSFINGMIGLTTLFSLIFLTSMARYLSRDVEHLIGGIPCILVSHGEFIVENMHRERVDAEEIFGEMHKAGLHKLEQVKWAILEADGKISVISEDPSQEIINRPDEDHAIG